ncbi:hypothetical protein SAMN05444156_2429 [Verrucomicrobium sp. GAS474]|uniref:hypothetical protein n=1 Tax=Verrucomicrobium sp. GAS474 TaxID=1882831 RepID=UPI00087ACCD8|nr:hypothetical protein [Verrucomicrobium sp. GAS474]SDU17758.1 hypothetical protein SAMN05444156_2429 [Verrucomicrobium sp. GAS474]
MAFFVSFLNQHRRGLAWSAAVLLLLLAVGIAGGFLVGERLTAYVASDLFRDRVSESTSHGLKVEGKYDLFHPDGLEVTTAGWRSVGRPGESIAALDADGIAGRFNPWGVLLRRWTLDWVSLDHASITLRKADQAAKIPLPVKKKPWYAFLMPKRIYLKEVRCESGEVLWNFRGQTGGIHHIRVLITPYGKKDWRFESYDGSGALDFPPLPPLRLAEVSATLSKPWLTLEHVVLAPADPADPGRFYLSGKAGLQQDKSLVLQTKFDRMPLSAWLPEDWSHRIAGTVDGEAAWDGDGTRLEKSHGDGALRVNDGTASHLPLLDQLALFSGNPAFRDLHFSRVSLAWRWRDPAADITDIAVEVPGLASLNGNVHVEGGVLSGTIRFGLRPDDLKWLPKHGVTLFPEERDGFRWTEIALSGTIEKPKEDFTPRLRAALFHSPGTLLKLGWTELFAPDGIGK